MSVKKKKQVKSEDELQAEKRQQTIDTLKKARYFAFLVYAENITFEELVERLKATHGQFAISPLHSPDKESKKPHWHVIYCHGNTITLKGALNVLPADIVTNGHIEMVFSPRGYERYLIHLDDPEKEQFEDGEDAITLINDYKLDLSSEMTRNQIKRKKRELTSRIRDTKPMEYSNFIYSLLDDGDDDGFEVASTNTIFFNALITSERNKWNNDGVALFYSFLVNRINQMTDEDIKNELLDVLNKAFVLPPQPRYRDSDLEFDDWQGERRRLHTDTGKMGGFTVMKQRMKKTQLSRQLIKNSRQMMNFMAFHMCMLSTLTNWSPL